MATSLDNDLLKSTLRLIGKKSPTTIFFFDRPEFCMCFGDDAKFVATKIFQSSAFLKELNNGPDTIPYITVNKNQFQRIVRDLLLVYQYRIELYQCRNRKAVWDLASKASPGNFDDFEEILAEMGDSDSVTVTVVALKLKHVAIACCDKTNQQFIVTEFPDNIHFSSVQAILVHFAPKEILLPAAASDADYKCLEPILRRFGVVTYAKTNDFNSVDIVQNLNRLLKFPKDVQPNAFSLPETKLSGAMGCVSALIGYLRLLSDPSAFGQYSMRKASFDQYMRLDASVIRAFDLFDLSGDPKIGYGSKSTLFGLLNRCRTAPGKRLLDQWIKMPLLDVNKINERLDVVEAFVSDLEISQNLSNILARFPDIQRISKAFLKNKATLLDLYKLYQAAILIPRVIEMIDQIDCQKRNVTLQSVLEQLQESHIDLKKLVELANTTLDLANARNFEVLIKPSYNPQLATLKGELDEIEEKIQDEANRAGEKLGLEKGKAKLESNAQLGYYLRVTNKDEKALRNRRGITIIGSDKSGIKFHTTAMRELNDEYRSKLNNYEKVQGGIAIEVLKVAVSYLDPLQRLCSVMASLDVLLSFATVSRSYTRPVVMEKDAGILELRGCRHPCLESNENIPFIPNDVYFERGKTEFLLITGPNMGGKSTYLRQTGLIVLLAQIGCFVPCSSARISIVDAIFTRVGASDAQLEGASTFRMEMIEMASIFGAATCNSLILIDELGRGTSTYDGCALAWSTAEHIAQNIRAWCMFATHFHELTAMDIDLPTVQNLHVTADIADGRFTLLYQVKPGPCGASFGLHIAQMLKLPESIIEDATKVLDEFAWSQPKEEAMDVDGMECDSPGPSSPSSSSFRDLSAASFVAETQRIMRNDRSYATVKEKANALRNLLTTGI